MDDRDEWRERVREIRASSMTWWWWWWYITHVCVHKILQTTLRNLNRLINLSKLSSVFPCLAESFTQLLNKCWGTWAIIIIIIIRACRQYEILLVYRPSLLSGPIDGIQCPHRDCACNFCLSVLSIYRSPACFACLTWIVCEMEGKCPYKFCFYDLFKAAHRILV